MSETNLTAIILAAGDGSRMQLEITKQKIIIANESVLFRAVNAFESCTSVTDIIVVARPDEIDFVSSELSSLKKVKKIVAGGKTRVQSAKNGFLTLKSHSGYVAIHDAARCLVTPDMIEAVFDDAKEYGAATASAVVTDTVKRVNNHGMISETLDRNELRLMQTPQIFKAELYKKALEAIDDADASITDDNMLLEKICVPVFCTDTGKTNIKITVKEDLQYAKFLLSGGKNDA